MDIYVFSDESGVFDCKHHEWFVYAGIIVVGKLEMDSLTRRYIAIEKNLRKNSKYRTIPELKGSFLNDKSKRKLLSVFSDTMKFAVAIRQKKLDYARVFSNTKMKQDYLDFAYRSVLRKAFEEMIAKGSLFPGDEFNLFINEDNRHVTVDILHRKEEMIFREFKEGIYNSKFGMFSTPLFSDIQKVQITLRDSDRSALVRGADIIANTVYTSLFNESLDAFLDDSLFHIELLP